MARAKCREAATRPTSQAFLELLWQCTRWHNTDFLGTSFSGNGIECVGGAEANKQTSVPKSEGKSILNSESGELEAERAKLTHAPPLGDYSGAYGFNPCN